MRFLLGALMLNDRQVHHLPSLGLIAVLTFIAATPAVSAPMFVPGGWNVDSWNPNSNPMTDNLDGTYSVTIANQTPGQRYEFKIVEDTNSNGGDWGPDPNRPNANSWAYADGSGNLTINFDTNVVSDGWVTGQYRIGGNAANMDPGAWTFVGDFQGEVGGSDWTNNDPVTSMSAIGAGIYEWAGLIPAGSYIGKGTRTGSWDAIGSDNRSIDAGNISFNVDAPSQLVRFRVDALRGVAQISVVPEPASTTLVALAGLLFAWGAARSR